MYLACERELKVTVLSWVKTKCRVTTVAGEHNYYIELYLGLQASATIRKFGVITKYTEICIAGNPLDFNFKPHLEGDTHQFTADPLHNEAMAANIVGESR